MARSNAISAIAYSTLLVAFLLVSNVECTIKPNAMAAAATNSGLSCSMIYGFQFGDTCSSIIQNFGLSADSFSTLNPNLNCDKIFVGEWLCLNGGSSN